MIYLLPSAVVGVYDALETVTERTPMAQDN